MENQNKTRNIFLAILFIVAIGLGVLTNSYLITGMYILTILAAVYIIKDKDIYNLLYATLLVSLFYDYTLHVPKIESIYFFHIVLGIFTLLSLYKVFKDRDILAKLDKKILIFFIIWFIYMCMSVAWALSKGLAIKYIAIYIMMFAFIVDMMIYNINKERLKETIKLLLLLISIVVVVGAVEVLLGQQLPVKHYYDTFKLSNLHLSIIRARPIVFSFNTNNLAALLAILSPICFYAIYKFQNTLLKIIFTIVTCIAFSLIMIITSRTGYVSMLFGFVVYCIYSIFNIKNIKLKGVIFPIIIAISFIFLYKYSFMFMNIRPIQDEVNGKTEVGNILAGKMHSLESKEFEEGGEGSENVRWTIINDVINGVIKEKKYFGYGVGNVEEYIRQQGNTNKVYSPHCYAIEILGDFGVIGILLYGVYYLYLLIGNLVIGIRKKKIMCFATVSGLIAFAPASFGPSSITYVLSYWVLMGFAISCIQVYKSEETDSLPEKIKEFHF
ncbi:O-antigen ligase family protein [Clostridium weizhouense]|uniref:O-antigen ligase family protein n=1 Tax=Clostridium weizhouense TaxID=2859781 RepID=A0ABS7AQ52_9CLOT|nr:O-antigen ligase family protein [Clostridium weizhouense]MBW6410800.1 O-antigen ligase family protein [Clostridium weizhouense]